MCFVLPNYDSRYRVSPGAATTLHRTALRFTGDQQYTTLHPLLTLLHYCTVLHCTAHELNAPLSCTLPYESFHFLSNVHVGTIALSSLEGDALLTDFSFSTDIFTHNIDSDNGDYRTETEEDIFSAGTVMLQLLTGQHDTNHR